MIVQYKCSPVIINHQEAFLDMINILGYKVRLAFKESGDLYLHIDLNVDMSVEHIFTVGAAIGIAQSSFIIK